MTTSKPRTAQASQSLYERIGGAPAINAAVDEFYERVLADPDLARFFRAKQMKNLKQAQVDFFTQSLGGPAVYKGRSMSDAHARLPITAEQFGKVADHLGDALRHLGVEHGMVSEVISAVAPLADDIVKPAAAVPPAATVAAAPGGQTVGPDPPRSCTGRPAPRPSWRRGRSRPRRCWPRARPPM